MSFQAKNYLDFVKLDMPQNVNIINYDMDGSINYPVPSSPTRPYMVKYISIGWSNYGKIYVVSDKRECQIQFFTPFLIYTFLHFKRLLIFTNPIRNYFVINQMFRLTNLNFRSI